MKYKKLAVVVPMFNIAEFLEEALDSILKQGLSDEDMQIILIDDGSTDGTIDIANQYVAKYPKLFEIHIYKNGGLGAARNRGTSWANSEYITYVDPDDLIPDNSYEFMLNIVTKTHSDIITGHVRRFNDRGKVWVPELHQNGITGEFRNTNINAHPELIWDASSWNKLYKLDFLINNKLHFPEGVLYEDFPMVNAAFAKANSIDVTTRVVYMWRVRQGSITNKSTGSKATLDRIKVNRLALKGISKANVSDSVKKVLISKSLNMGIVAMLQKEHYSLISYEGRKEIFHSLQAYLRSIPEKLLVDVKFENLVYFKKALSVSTLEKFDEITNSFLRNEIQYSGEWINNKWVLSSNLSDLKKEAASSDFIVNTKLTYAALDDKYMYLTGYVFAKYSDMSEKEFITNASVDIVSEYNEILATNVAKVELIKNENITSKFGYVNNSSREGKPNFNYDYSGYEIKIELKDFLPYNSRMHLRLKFNVDNQFIQTDIKTPLAGSKTRPDVKVIPALSAAIDVTYNSDDWVLEVIARTDIATLELNSKLYSLNNVYEHSYIEKDGEKIYLSTGESGFYFSKSAIAKLNKYNKNNLGKWKFMTSSVNKLKPIYLIGENNYISNDVFSSNLIADSGVATLKIDWIYPTIKKIGIHNGILTLDFFLSGWEAEAVSVQVMADNALNTIVWDTHKINASTYRLIIPLGIDGFSDKPWLNFQILMKFSDGYTTKQILKWGENHDDLEGKIVSVNGISWEFRRVLRNRGGFAIKRTADRLYRQEIGGFEHFIDNEYKRWLSEPLLDNTIMFSSFWGRNNMFNDNPEAIYQYICKNYPNMNSIIMLKDAIRSYPEYKNAKVVSYGTKEYWYYLARSKYFVNNVNYTEEQRIKRDGQIELQTMHGTPLKTLGFEVLNDWTDKTYNAVKKKNNNWDYLLTSSDWVASYAKRVFENNPIVINSGYPRNDKLFKNYSNADILSIKAKLNLPLNKQIIIFAPTWHKRGSTPISKYLNVENLYKSIPNNALVVLKNHHYEKWTDLPNDYSDKLVYADDSATIEDLYIVSDALITDYSSVMFDYAILKKPIIFYAFDYDKYVLERGINFDLKLEAPGPFVETQDKLEFWLNNISKIPIKFKEKINEFNSKFIKYDKGNATEIAVKNLLSTNEQIGE
ncbi:bifunctional glycosyltransferase/CDP-glycerol:glycerophosphate glycerophosphotransferase [Weissella hellenica]|uniref:bifunctional glycosyltransferase/CDP-glycerol:glycerophosphate glycerophosphotransferase n=1 Tax=Weissella hellenica TaxID=46256 RepID=UPI003889D26C